MKQDFMDKRGSQAFGVLRENPGCLGYQEQRERKEMEGHLEEVKSACLDLQAPRVTMEKMENRGLWDPEAHLVRRVNKE